MPRLSRAAFLATADDFVHLAVDNLTRDGFLAPHVAGLSDKTGVTTVLLVPPGQDVSAAVAARAPQGTHVVHGDLKEPAAQAEIARILRERGCVAALVVSEAWHATIEVDPQAEAPVRIGAVADRDDKREAILVAAFWPREYVFRKTMVPFVRRPVPPGSGAPEGPPVVDTDQDHWVVSTAGNDLGAGLDWLAEALPQPPGRVRRR